MPDRIQTPSERDWLQTQIGQDWLQTHMGREWLLTQEGGEWLQTRDGRKWLQTQEQDWLQTHGREEWIAEPGRVRLAADREWETLFAVPGAGSTGLKLRVDETGCKPKVLVADMKWT